MLYNIADLIVDMEIGERTAKNAYNYVYNGNLKPEFEVITNHQEALDLYPAFANADYPDDYKNKALDYIYERNVFAKKILKYNGIVLHSSAVVVDGCAYLFSAPSGTGKSTHTGNWLKIFGDKAFILNDDRPTVRILEDGVYAYGTPWCGSTNINTNAKARLQGICFLQRDDHNWIKNMNAQSAMLCLLYASAKKLTMDEMGKQADIINKIVECIPIYEMGCTPTIEAAQMAYDVMSKGEVK